MSDTAEPRTVPLDLGGLIDEARAAERASRHDVARKHYEGTLHRLRHADHVPLASALLRWIGRAAATMEPA